VIKRKRRRRLFAPCSSFQPLALLLLPLPPPRWIPATRGNCKANGTSLEDVSEDSSIVRATREHPGFSLPEGYLPRWRRSAARVAAYARRPISSRRRLRGHIRPRESRRTLREYGSTARIRELAERRATPRRSTGVEVPRQTVGCHPRSYPRTSAISTLPPSFRELYACPQEIHPRRISRPCLHTHTHTHTHTRVRVRICIYVYTYLPALENRGGRRGGGGSVCVRDECPHARTHAPRYFGIEDARGR